MLVNDWLDLTLEQIILEYGDDGGETPLNGDEVNRLVEILKAKINLNQGNITQREYELVIDNPITK